MSKADTTDGGSSASDATADTIDSGSRPVADSGADSGADTEVATEKEMRDSQSRGQRTSPDDLIGITLAERYQVTAKLGQGGMGAVYEGRHTVIGKRIAVKVLLDKHADKEQVVARLKQEARLASSIGHDNIIDITDFGTTMDGRTFVVMEYLEGESLGQCIAREGRLDPDRAVRIAAQIASALTAAHAKGVVHRDIKPENIFLLQRSGSDFVKVVDFGISKSMTPNDEDVRLTQTGMVLGTPLYMSPEQARGDEDLDHRIDIYALGVILYETVTGKVPFQGTNYLNILTQVIADDPPRPTELRPDLDRDVESVILKAMAKDPKQRYATMADLESDLRALIDPDASTTGARISAARWRKKQDRRPLKSYIKWTGGVIAVGALAILAVSALMEDSDKGAAKAAAAVIDAGPKIEAPPPPDARVRDPAAETATMNLTSSPTGATIYDGDRVVCDSTPCTYNIPKGDPGLELHAKLAGYETGNIPIRPSIDDGKVIETVLRPLPVKQPKGKHGPRKGGNKGGSTGGTQGGDSSTTTHNGPNSDETMGNPFRKSK